jgi:tRNA pseudouridine55 synthase
VKVTELQLVSYAYPHACLHIECGAGTYVRSLVHDLGQILRCGAYLESLKRLRVGPWKLEDACSLASQKVSWARVVPLKEVLCNFPRLDLTEEQWEDVRNGRSIGVRLSEEPLIAWHDGLPVAILERDRKDSAKAHPKKVF